MGETPSMDDLKSRLDDESSDDEATDVDEDVLNAESVNMRPESVVHFEEIVDFGFAGDVTDEQNIAGETEGYGGNIAITLREPSVGGGHLYKSTDPSQAAGYKLVGDYNVDDEYDSNGDTVGIKYGVGASFSGELVDDFDEEYVTIYMGGGMGTYIGRVLDAYGGPDASVGGLVEFPPEGRDEKAAVRARPVLREDMRNEGGAIMARFPDSADLDGSPVPFFGSVFMNGGDYTELSPIRDTEHEGYSEEVEDRFVGDLHWSKDEGPSSSATTENSTNDLDLSLDTDDDVSYDSLADEWQAFVDQVAAQDVGVEDLDVGALAGGFAEDNDLDDQPSTSDLVDVIETRE